MTVKPMKSANTTFGGTPSTKPADQRRPSESHMRLPSARAPRAGAKVERVRWGRCEESTPSAAPATGRRRKPAEPRSGVVRRVVETSSQRESGLVERSEARREPSGRGRAVRLRDDRARDSGEWRCLEWGQDQRERPLTRNPKVTIVQLSGSDLIRQNGPDAWLPEAGDFVHRMARLVAHGLGFERCRAVCLRSGSAVLTVAEAGEAKVVAVSGPSASMTNVLRRAGLE